MNVIILYKTFIASLFSGSLTDAFSPHRVLTNNAVRLHQRSLPTKSTNFHRPLRQIFETKKMGPISSTTLHYFGKSRQKETAVRKYDPADIDDNQTETMRFGGKSNYTSIATLTVPADVEILYEFFRQSKNQQVLLTGGRYDTGDLEMVDIELIDTQKWIDNARLMGGDEPDFAKDKIVQVTPDGIGILTAEICPLSIIGGKVTSTSAGENNSSALPEYQAVLIHDYPRAKGPRPLVWLFNKILYGGDPDDETKILKPRRREEKAMLRFWAERLPSTINATTTETFVFKAEAELWVEFDFPRRLLRFFPLSKEKAEAISSDAITKALNMKIRPAVERFTEIYSREQERPIE